MRTITVLIFCCLLSFSLSAQRLHMPEEVIRIMEESTITYVFDSLKTTLPKSSFPNIGQQSNQLIRIDEFGETQLQTYRNEYSKKQKKGVKKGDKMIAKGRYEKARDCYNKVLEQNTSNHNTINKIASTYLKEKDYSTAAYWYERSLEFNYIDTEARLKLAQCYSMTGEPERAMDNIIYAHIFNRNNKNILEQLENIFKQNEYEYLPIEFNPVFQINQKSNNRININYGHSVWAAYAAVEAVWLYEEGYKMKMTDLSTQEIDIVQTKEALMNALVTYERLPYGNKEELFPLLDILSVISLKKQIDNFVLYEIISRENPMAILALPKEKIEKLKEYLLIYRVKN